MDVMTTMRTGWRVYGAARLYVRQCPALPIDTREKTREIRSLETRSSSQRQGHATMLMRRVCLEADRYGLTLVLWPAPWGDNIAMSKNELTDWYERRFGFKLVQTEPVPLMARAVGATPPSILKLNTVTESIHGKP